MYKIDFPFEIVHNMQSTNYSIRYFDLYDSLSLDRVWLNLFQKCSEFN